MSLGLDKLSAKAIKCLLGIFSPFKKVINVTLLKPRDTSICFVPDSFRHSHIVCLPNPTGPT